MVKMEFKYLFKLLVFAAVTLLSGCAQYSQTTFPPETVCLQNVENEQAMQTAQDVLAQMHFVVEKYDFDAGVIRTKPLRGAQFFEFWRSENVDPFSSAQANIHSIQRIVTLKFSTEPDGICVDCNVAVRRLSIPESKITGVSHSASMFTRADRSIQQLTLNPEQKEQMVWIDLGSDAALETKIIELIRQKIQSGGLDKS